MQRVGGSWNLKEIAMRKLWWVFVAVLFLMSGNAFALLVPGDIQPDFTLPKFGTTQQYNLHRDFSGKIIVLDFFAYWCGPCAAASQDLGPNVQQYYAARGGNIAHIPVQIVSVNTDPSSPSLTQAFITANGVDFALDDQTNALFSQHNTGYIPRFAIIDCAADTNHAQYQIVWTNTGYGGYTAFRNQIDSITYTGDANRDGKVDVLDLCIALTNFDKSNMSWAQGDFDGNKTVNFEDMSKVLTKYDKFSAPGGAGITAVAEPSGLILLAVGGLALLLLRAKRRAS
jgi:thiol-disulfide isomerase/thioredoxin